MGDFVNLNKELKIREQKITFLKSEKTKESLELSQKEEDHKNVVKSLN